MYSGSDSTESQPHPQWPLNPSAYQNMSNDQVDWAALAQQWIIMKEAGPPPVPKLKPPRKEPPNEGGEAPMDVESEDKDQEEWNGPNSWNWNTQTQSWGWMPPTGVPPPPVKAPLLPTPPAVNFNSFSGPPPESISDNASFPGYNTAGAGGEFSAGYWTAGGSKQVKPHNRRFSKVNVPRPVQAVVDAQPTLDANKRKQLPAWIREGLEKMERDKQKMLEREKEKQEREEYKEKLKQNEKETMEILKTTIQEQQRSKFESDGESEEEPPEKKKSHPQVEMTPAEQMLNVRRTMTEILLKVTNRELEVICREELQRHLKKKKASDQRVVSAPSGANVSAKLGLGIYGGDSDSGSDEESERENGDDRDSDVELKDSIRRKKAEFSKTEKEIEDKLMEAESRKPEVVSRTPSPDTNDNDTQVDAKSQGGTTVPTPITTPTPTKQRPTSKRHSTPRSTSSSSDSTSSTSTSSKRSSRRRRHHHDASSHHHHHPRTRSRSRGARGRSRRRSSPSPPPSSKSRRMRGGGGGRRTRSRERRYSRERRGGRRSRSRGRRGRSRSSSRSSGRGKRSRRR